MPRRKTTQPRPTKLKGQRSLELPEYLTRWLPQWRIPEWYQANQWRAVVRNQPFTMDCRETLISNIEAMDWKIEPRDSDESDELKEEIKYYENLFEDSGEYDYYDTVEWVTGDYLDIPFGAGVELGWEGDVGRSKLIWYHLIDGATLFPTLSEDYPVGQAVQEAVGDVVYFPKHAVNRLKMSPRPEMKRQGWGMAPPEKIYLALTLLYRGDSYYANLLLDTPEVGILDLGDIDEESAKSWIKSWRELLTGIDPFKIPVLYAHDKPAQFISFSRSPHELLFNRTIMLYAAIVAGGYGLSLSDVGIQAASSGGDTLAGSIRQERKTRKTGLARLKNRLQLFYNRMLPENLKYNIIDLDDELSVALGRARLANATAWGQMIDRGMFSAGEGRRQTIADGLTTISLPEEPPEDAQSLMDIKSQERPGMLGKPVSPSQGGHGEVTKSLTFAYDLLKEEDNQFREIAEEIERGWEGFDIRKKAKISETMEDTLIDLLANKLA